MAVLKIKDQNGNEIPITSIAGKSAYSYAQDGGYTGTAEEFAQKLAEEYSYISFDEKTGELAISSSGTVANNDYELIESYTTTEEVTSVGRTTEPDGTPYDFQKVKIIILQPASSNSGFGGIRLFDTNVYDYGYAFIRSGTTTAFNTTSYTFSQYIGEIDNGVLRCTSACSSTPASTIEDVEALIRQYGYLNASISTPLFDMYDYVKLNNIEYVRYSSLNGYTIPIGTRIDIYAVRS